jgi:hypothetical protein
MPTGRPLTTTAERGVELRSSVAPEPATATGAGCLDSAAGLVEATAGAPFGAGAADRTLFDALAAGSDFAADDDAEYCF